MATKDKVVNLEILKASQDYLDAKCGDLKSALDYKSFTDMPPAFKTANYSNASGTRAYKWAGTYLKTYQKVSAGAVAKNSVNNGLASLTVDGSLVIDMRECDNAYFMAKYTSTFISEAGCFLLIRFLNTSYGNPTSAGISLPTGTNKSVFVDLRKLAYENGVSLNDKPMVLFREVGYEAHTATDVEELEFDFYGFHALPLTNEVKSSATEDFIYRFKPYYAHLFINTVSDAASDTYVPSQSAQDIEIAARLGFNSIELNTHVLSDGAVLVMHGASGKFGTECVAASGSAYTDEQIQDTSFDTVSLEWVKNNVVFKAKYPKSQTAPLTLEEALCLCKTNHLVPFVQRADENTVALCDKIMGKDNYVLYNPARSDRAKSNAMMIYFGNATEAEIYDWVKLFGSPCAYGTSNYGAFTLEKWKEIVDNVHKMGGLMAFAASYMTPVQANDLWEIGFDFAGSGLELNPVTEANLCTLIADNGFDDFTVANGEEADGQVTLAENGTIIPAETVDSVFLSGMWLDVTFKGSISVAMGRFITHENSGITSATRKTIHLSTYALNSAPTFEIKATAADTVIENVVFKASKL